VAFDLTELDLVVAVFGAGAAGRDIETLGSNQ
jgi:hypothetical protein